MSDEILIVGGGFAGLAAGVALSKAGQRVRLLEQKPHLGGRARSFSDPTTGSVVDNGQHLLMGCYRATLGFLEEIGTLDRLALQPRLKMQFLEGRGRLTSFACCSLPAPWHVFAGVLSSDSSGWREKREIFRLGRALRAGKDSGQNLERLTVEEWLSALGQSEKLRRNFWDLLAIAAMNEDPRVAAAVLFQRVLRLALFTSPAASRLAIPRVGMSECYTPAASAYITARGGRVELGRNVTGFLITDGVCEGVQLADGEKIEARAVVSAVPWFELVRLLPGDLLRSEAYFTNILALRPAPIISINLWFDRAITELDFVGLRGATVQWLFNRGRTQGSGENHISLVLSGAHAHIGRPKEELLAIALRDLGELLPATRQARLVHSLVIKERFATFSPCVGVEEVRPAARTPVRGLYLAGDWTATGLPATIEGAVQSGNAAAREVMQAK
jgi:zeta-carotene desaturase